MPGPPNVTPYEACNVDHIISALGAACRQQARTRRLSVRVRLSSRDAVVTGRENYEFRGWIKKLYVVTGGLLWSTDVFVWRRTVKGFEIILTSNGDLLLTRTGMNTVLHWMKRRFA